MSFKKILIITRIIKSKDTNQIYNIYTQGIIDNYKDTIVIDYYDLYFNKGKRKFEEEILNIIETNNINFTFINFVSGDLTLDLNFVHKISQNSFLMMNFFDSELFFEPVDRYYAQCADLVIIPSSSVFTYNYKLLNINVKSTLSLFDISMYRYQNLTKDIEISFVGDMTKKSRKDFVDYLTNNGYKVEVYGLGSKNGRVSFDKMVNIFNRSKINLNFSDTVDDRSFNINKNMDYSMIPNIYQYIQQLKGRTIEITLCKSFALTQNAFGIEELFTTKQIGIFNTKEELLEKVKYYLENEEERIKMENSAYEDAVIKFNSTKQFKNILDSINIKDRKIKTIYTDNSFLSNYYSYHTLYLFNFLFTLRFQEFYQEFKIIEFSKLRLLSSYSHFKQQFKFQIINKFFKGKK